MRRGRREGVILEALGMNKEGVSQAGNFTTPTRVVTSLDDVTPAFLCDGFLDGLEKLYRQGLLKRSACCVSK